MSIFKSCRHFWAISRMVKTCEYFMNIFKSCVLRSWEHYTSVSKIHRLFSSIARYHHQILSHKQLHCLQYLLHWIVDTLQLRMTGSFHACSQLYANISQTILNYDGSTIWEHFFWQWFPMVFWGDGRQYRPASVELALAHPNYLSLCTRAWYACIYKIECCNLLWVNCLTLSV